MKYEHLCRLIQKLREHQTSPELDSRSKGLLGNILGELKDLESGATVEMRQVSGELKELMRVCKASAVISAYLSERQDLDKRIRELEAQIPDLYDE